MTARGNPTSPRAVPQDKLLSKAEADTLTRQLWALAYLFPRRRADMAVIAAALSFMTMDFFARSLIEWSLYYKLAEPQWTDEQAVAEAQRQLRRYRDRFTAGLWENLLWMWQQIDGRPW